MFPFFYPFLLRVVLLSHNPFFNISIYIWPFLSFRIIQLRLHWSFYIMTCLFSDSLWSVSRLVDDFLQVQISSIRTRSDS